MIDTLLLQLQQLINARHNLLEGAFSPDRIILRFEAFQADQTDQTFGHFEDGIQLLYDLNSVGA